MSDEWIRRFQSLPQEDVCSPCGSCVKQKWCEPSRIDDPRLYNGIRITNDGNDCALPVVLDSHSRCSFECAYCFSENSFGHVAGKKKGLGQTSLPAIERIFNGGGGQMGEVYRKALRYDKRNAQGFPSPIQIGGINDPCDNIERQQGWLLRFLKLAIKYNQPVRLSTKGTVLLEKEYQKVISRAPHLFWFLVSIITPDEKLAAKVERYVPSPKKRIEVIKAMSSLGCHTGLRFRPVVPGMSDCTPSYPKAYKTLIDWAADAGAKSMEYEILYAPMRFFGEQLKRWNQMEKQIGVPIKEAYKRMGRSQASLRPSAAWSEQIVHAIYEAAKDRGMIVGVSEPSWKGLNDGGCCCGMTKDHPVFGNFEPRNATQALVDARDTGKLISLDDVTPEWAKGLKMSTICNIGGAGPKGAYDKRHVTYAEFIKRDWDNSRSTRNPAVYFQGAFQPVAQPNGETLYQYVEQPRHNRVDTPYWNTED